MTFLIVLLGIVSFFYFSLTIGQHFKLLSSQQEMSRGAFIACQLLAWAVLSISIYPAVVQWPYQIGLLNWVLLLHISALVIVVLLSFFPRSYVFLGNKLYTVVNPETYKRAG